MPLCGWRIGASIMLTLSKEKREHMQTDAAIGRVVLLCCCPFVTAHAWWPLGIAQKLSLCKLKCVMCTWFVYMFALTVRIQNLSGTTCMKRSHPYMATAGWCLAIGMWHQTKIFSQAIGHQAHVHAALTEDKTWAATRWNGHRAIDYALGITGLAQTVWTPRRLGSIAKQCCFLAMFLQF